MKNDFDKYENLIFDLGGVLLKIDFNRGLENFSKLFNVSKDDILVKIENAQFLDLFETGEITPQEFRQSVRNLFKSSNDNSITDSQIDNAWNSIICEFIIENLNIVLKLNQSKRLFLLSNTNQIHEQKILEILNNQTKNINFDVYFEKVYMSHHIGLRKPNTKIYKLVIEENDLYPKNTIFIDDVKQNILGAKKLELATLLVKSNEFKL